MDETTFEIGYRMLVRLRKPDGTTGLFSLAPTPLRVEYRPGEWTEPVGPVARWGYGLSYFPTAEEAAVWFAREWQVEPTGYSLWKCSVREPYPALPRYCFEDWGFLGPEALRGALEVLAQQEQAGERNPHHAWLSSKGFPTGMRMAHALRPDAQLPADLPRPR